MPDINPSLPVVGQPDSTEEPKIVTALSQLIATINDLDESNISAAGLSEAIFTTTLQRKLGLNEGAQVGRGSLSIATAQAMPVDTSGVLSTPDRISGLVLPTDGLIAVQYFARWTVVSTANSGQLVGVGLGLSGTSIKKGSTFAFDELPFSGDSVNTGTYSGYAMTAPSSSLGAMAGAGSFASLSGTMPTTGLLVGGWVLIEAAAGTYDVEAYWRRLSARTSSGTVQDRRLRAVVVGF